MSKYRYLTVLLALSLALCLSSCFKDEPLNAECDIEQAYLRAGDHLGSWFLFDSDTLRNVQSDQTTIEFTMSGQADLSRLAPYFRISPAPRSRRPAAAYTTSPKAPWNTRSHRRTASGRVPTSSVSRR